MSPLTVNIAEFQFQRSMIIVVSTFKNSIRRYLLKTNPLHLKFDWEAEEYPDDFDSKDRPSRVQVLKGFQNGIPAFHNEED